MASLCASGHVASLRMGARTPSLPRALLGLLTSSTFLSRPSGPGMSTGQGATRPWASKAQHLPPLIATATGRRLPSGNHLCQEAGSTHLPAHLSHHVEG